MEADVHYVSQSCNSLNQGSGIIQEARSSNTFLAASSSPSTFRWGLGATGAQNPRQCGATSSLCHVLCFRLTCLITFPCAAPLSLIFARVWVGGLYRKFNELRRSACKEKVWSLIFLINSFRYDAHDVNVSWSDQLLRLKGKAKKSQPLLTRTKKAENGSRGPKAWNHHSF